MESEKAERSTISVHLLVSGGSPVALTKKHESPCGQLKKKQNKSIKVIAAPKSTQIRCGNFSLVQNFMELLATALEEKFCGLKFHAFSTWRLYMHLHVYRSTSNFAVHIFAAPDLSTKREILHHAKISRYSVYYRESKHKDVHYYGKSDNYPINLVCVLFALPSLRYPSVLLLFL
jgi:hypothetical protein